jgi:hypothetical protein
MKEKQINFANIEKEFERFFIGWNKRNCKLTDVYFENDESSYVPKYCNFIKGYEVYYKKQWYYIEIYSTMNITSKSDGYNVHINYYNLYIVHMDDKVVIDACFVCSCLSNTRIISTVDKIIASNSKERFC